ncbi:MAG: DUF1194 domain-containing protein [Pseudooceanicola sp.]
MMGRHRTRGTGPFWRAPFAVLGMIAASALPAWGGCRLALALALDVSGSVDQVEYRLQLDGLANALENPDVRDAIFAIPGEPVALAVYEWSGPAHQRVLADWRLMEGPADVSALASRLRVTQRVDADPSTAIGAAMVFGGAMLAKGPECWRQVIDVSGDGKSNTGLHPRDVRLPQTITINALTIGGELIDPGEMRHVTLGELSAYFRAFVLRGPQAFVETAKGFRAFEEAMVRKLQREMLVLAVSDRFDRRRPTQPQIRRSKPGSLSPRAASTRPLGR